MHITLHDANSIRLSFAYSAATVAKVKALPGATWDKERKEWTVNLSALRRVMSLFPGVTVDRAVIDARLAMWRRWVRQHNSWGIWLAYADDGRTVVPVSDDGELSPCFVEHVASRSDILAQFLGDQVQPASAPAPVRTVEPTRGDRLIWNGLQNAARAEEKRAEVVERAKGKRRAAKQMSLLEDA